MCICLKEPWQNLQNYRVRQVGDEIVIGPYVDVAKVEEPQKFNSPDASDNLLISPYSTAFRSKYPELAVLAWMLKDLASSLLRKNGPTEVIKLVDHLRADERLKDVEQISIEGFLRCCVASRYFSVKSDKRKKNPPIVLHLSSTQLDIEQRRTFAGTFAGELVSLSERVRHLIDHPSTVGTYRENLLQTLLRKHLPEPITWPRVSCLGALGNSTW